MRFTLLALVLWLTISSCISTARLKQLNTSEMLSTAKSFIDGSYSNDENKSSYTRLWGILGESYSGKLKVNRFQDSCYVRLELVNENLLNIKLLSINTNAIVDEFNLKGKIEDSYFSINRKFFLLPIPLLFIHIESKSLVGSSKDGNLVVIHGQANQGWILVLAGGNQYSACFQFKKYLN